MCRWSAIGHVRLIYITQSKMKGDACDPSYARLASMRLNEIRIMDQVVKAPCTDLRLRRSHPAKTEEYYAPDRM
jgi:hypothetical protein